MMKIFYMLLFLPAFVFAQTGKKSKAGLKIKPQVTTGKKLLDGFIIEGIVKGFPDGTKVDLLNGQTGVSETSTTIQKDKFTIKGKMATPDFRIIIFNNQPPFITLFMDNSAMKITGTKEKIETAQVTGSKTQADYETFNKAMESFKAVFDENAPFDSVTSNKAMQVTGDFARQHPNSYITPLAIIRYNQVADDPANTETMFNALPAEIKATSMGNYVAQYIADAKKNAVGTLLPDFTQADTTGTPVSLSSLRGKYVLIDFWASWCGPCRKENPNVVATFNKFRNKNFTILGVSLDKAKPAWEEAIHMDNLNWTHVSDLQGWSNAAALQFQIFSIPQNILVDPEGKIVAKNLRGTQLERKLSKVLR